MFAVIHLEAVPDHLRGYLSRFLQEVRTGLYVGVATPPVIDQMWDRTCETAQTGTATLVLSDPTLETGFDIRLHRVTTHRIADIDGIRLPVERPNSAE
jgi:CRISPR-associated protein Cas2